MEKQNIDKSGEKITLKIKEHVLNEIIKDEQKKEKNKRIAIFNNKKNNVQCSNLLKSAINTEKELLFMPYAKEKQKINKTLDELGRLNGISYPSYRVIKGIIPDDDNYKVIVRGNDAINYNHKSHKFTLSKFKYNTAEINLDSDVGDY